MYSGVLLDFLNIGGGELSLIVVAILLLFGGKKMPELARGLGKGIREFKDASEEVKREIHRNINNVDIDRELRDDEDQKNKIEEENHAERHHPSIDEPSAQEETDPLIAKKVEDPDRFTKRDKDTEL